MTHPSTSATPLSNGTTTLRRLAAVVLLLLAPTATLVVWFVFRDDLPQRLATHWGLGAHPNGFTTATPFLAVATSIVVVLGVLVAVVAARPGSADTARPVAAIGGFLVWVLAGSTIAILMANHGLSDPHAARSGWPAALVVMVVSVGLSLAIAMLAPPAPHRAHAAAAEPPYELDRGERVTWVGSASSRPLLVMAGTAGVVGAVLLVLTQQWAVVLLVLALLLAWMHSVTVRVDDDGVRAHFGPLPWPAFRTPLSRIEGATADEVSPMQWGGWGYRISGRGTAIVVRRGPGLVLARRGRSDLAITVDHAGEAADAVNALLARAAADSG